MYPPGCLPVRAARGSYVRRVGSCAAELEREVAIEASLARAAEGAEVVPEPQSEALEAIGLNLAHAVAVIVAGPFTAIVVHRETCARMVVEIVVGVPLVAVHLCPRSRHPSMAFAVRRKVWHRKTVPGSRPKTRGSRGRSLSNVPWPLRRVGHYTW